MNETTREIEACFLGRSEPSWRSALASESPTVEGSRGPGPGLAVFYHAHACCGVMLEDDPSKVRENWQEWEHQLIQVHRQIEESDASPSPDAPSLEVTADGPRLSAPRDLFLVVVLENVFPDDAPALAEVANDPFGSRKILLAREHRSIRETLTDLAFFSARAAVPPGPEAPGGTGTPEVSLEPKVLEDLARRGADKIFDRLLAGQYQPANRPPS